MVASGKISQFQPLKLSARLGIIDLGTLPARGKTTRRGPTINWITIDEPEEVLDV